MGWHPNWELVSGVTAPQRSSIAAVSRGPDNLDLFVVATDGSIQTTYWKPDAGWHAWGNVMGGSAAPGSSIAAVSRGPDNLDLFVVATDGSIQTTYWKPDAGWHA